MSNLNNKVAVVTGGSSGIGWAYSATKAAVRSLGRTLAAELSRGAYHRGTLTPAGGRRLQLS